MASKDIMMELDISNTIQTACTSYVRLRSCAIWYGEMGAGEEVGTGFAIRFMDRLFVATCQHVAEGFKDSKRGLLSFKNGITLGRADTTMIFWDRDNDVAVIEIPDIGGAVPSFSTGQFGLVHDFGALSPIDQAFLLYGFPAEHVEIDDDRREFTGMSLFAERFGNKASTEDDLYLDFPKALGTRATNPPFAELPKANGISGSPVFSVPSFTADTPSLWTPESELKIIAIQVSWGSLSYLRCKSIRFLLDMLESLSAGSVWKGNYT